VAKEFGKSFGTGSRSFSKEVEEAHLRDVTNAVSTPI